VGAVVAPLTLAAAVIGLALPAAPGCQEPADPRAPVRAFVVAHCARCHDAGTRKGGLDLVGSIERGLPAIRDAALLWEEVGAAVLSRAMPPPPRAGEAGSARPGDEQRRGFDAALAGLLRAAAESGAPDPGRPVLRRLNRFEYANTVRDLLGVEVPGIVELLPEDPQGHGFDTVGDVLFSSPLLLERYWEATRLALDRALAEPAGALRAAVGAGEDGVGEFLRAFLGRAFRRPVEEREVEARLALLRRTVEGGASLEVGLRRALASAMLSPHFLFRVERDRPELGVGAVHRLDAHALAVRLSYFLWATMPDAELRDLADRGALDEERQLRTQVLRMLDDPRSASLAERFGAQWLGYGAVRGMARDVRRFGGFERLRGAMYEEARRGVDRLFRDDRPLVELLDCRWTFVDEALAAHYGIAGVHGPELRLVELEDRRRGGVLGWGAILAATATPLRTSPVQRGRFVLEELLGDAPPPPPPDAGTLPEDDQLGDGLSLRQRLERHRSDPRCAGCHARIDPYGLALEEFDPTGRVRSEVHGLPVDARAELPDGSTFEGVVGLKAHLLGRREVFERTFAARLLVYALGRPLGGADAAVLDEIVAATAREGGRARSLVVQVVLSFPFRHRRNP
jgi:hypothetical protein